MTRTRLFLAATLALTAVSCGHKADLYYPTVAEADAMDVQWGLEQRKPRGGPKQFYQYRSTDPVASSLSQPAAEAPSAPAPAVSAPTPAPAPATAPVSPAAQGRVDLIR